MRRWPWLLALACTACGGDEESTQKTGTGGAAGSGGSGGVDAGGSGGVSGGDASSGGSAGGTEYCNGQIGLTSPLSVCSEQSPCTNTPPLRPASITTATEIPTCATGNASHPTFADPQITRIDAGGVTRYACLYSPPGATPTSRRPLLVYFHGSFDTADAPYDTTLLREKAVSHDLSGDPARPGYFLLSINARNLHWPTTTKEDGAKEDTFHRDLGSPSGNPDLLNFDALVDDLVQQGAVDPKRIYVSGWSNGGRFAQLVGIARHETATPGGNRVAAAAVYSATDPFNNTKQEQVPSCALDPYPSSQLPVFLVGRACDILPCDEAQAAAFVSEGAVIDPGDVMSTWVSDLQNKIGSPSVERVIVNGLGQTVTTCSASSLCNYDTALLGHVDWPDGIGGNGDYEPQMLDFLKQHPLP
jgi:dienelactone hydrolase